MTLLTRVFLYSQRHLNNSTVKSKEVYKNLNLRLTVKQET